MTDQKLWRSRKERKEWARRFCARWPWAAPEMVEKFQQEFERVLAFFGFPAHWRHRLRTMNLGEGWFKHLRPFLTRFPGSRTPNTANRFSAASCSQQNRCITEELLCTGAPRNSTFNGKGRQSRNKERLG